MLTEKILVPLLRSLITALLVSLFTAAWFIAAIPWKLFFIVLSGSALVSWLAVILPRPSLDRQSLNKVYPIESQDPKPLKVSIDWNDGQVGLFSELGITREQFIAWCVGVGQGKSLGENHWCGSQGVFSKGEYHIFRDELERRGLLRPKGRHHAQGFELSAKGEAVATEVARRFGDHHHPNYPRLDDQTLVRPLPYLRESAREEGDYR